MTRFHLEMSASTRARKLYPDVRCQPMRPRSAMQRRCASRCVGAVSAALLGTAFARGGTMTAATGCRAATEMASARSAQSSRKKPLTRSAPGPGEITISPERTLTAAATGANPAPAMNMPRSVSSRSHATCPAS